MAKQSESQRRAADYVSQIQIGCLTVVAARDQLFQEFGTEAMDDLFVLADIMGVDLPDDAAGSHDTNI